MIGAIAGDMIGSLYERNPIKTKDFRLLVSAFTDDTVLTVAVAHAILNKTGYADAIATFAQRHHSLPYGGNFKKWMWSREHAPYNSWGNGSAMRVSPVGFAFDRLSDVLDKAERSAAVTHNHPEGIKGAQAVAMAIHMARFDADKDTIRKEISSRFGYDLDRKIDDIRPSYRFDVSCQGSVPESIIAFLESNSYEDAVKNAISLGGDADTMACIAGGIAQAYYKKLPQGIINDVHDKLSPDLLGVLKEFNRRYDCLFYGSGKAGLK